MFKEIPGYEGLYEINEYGCIKSMKSGKFKGCRIRKLISGIIYDN